MGLLVIALKDLQAVSLGGRAPRAPGMSPDALDEQGQWLVTPPPAVAIPGALLLVPRRGSDTWALSNMSSGGRREALSLLTSQVPQ